MEDGHPGNCGVLVPQIVMKNPGRDLEHAQIQHRNMKETTVSATTWKTHYVSNHIVQVTFHEEISFVI